MTKLIVAIIAGLAHLIISHVSSKHINDKAKYRTLSMISLIPLGVMAVFLDSQLSKPGWQDEIIVLLCVISVAILGGLLSKKYHEKK